MSVPSHPGIQDLAKVRLGHLYHSIETLRGEERLRVIERLDGFICNDGGQRRPGDPGFEGWAPFDLVGFTGQGRPGHAREATNPAWRFYRVASIRYCHADDIWIRTSL